MSQWTLACGISHLAATHRSASIRGSRCNALINVFAEEPRWWQRLWRWDMTCGKGRSLSVGHYESRRWRRIGIPTKAPQELPPPAPCVGLLILPMQQTIGPGSTQRSSTTAVPRATQTVGLGLHWESVPFHLEEAHCRVTSSQRGLSDITHVTP